LIYKSDEDDMRGMNNNLLGQLGIQALQGYRYSCTQFIEPSAKWVETYRSVNDSKSKLFRRSVDDAAALVVSPFACCCVFPTMHDEDRVSAIVAAHEYVAGIGGDAHLIFVRCMCN
jgi:hypothetical protein